MFLVDVQDNCLNLITDLDKFRRVTNMLTPGHLGDMNESLDTFFQLNKCAIVSNGNDLTLDPGFQGIFLFDIIPWIWRIKLSTRQVGYSTKPWHLMEEMLEMPQHACMQNLVAQLFVGRPEF